MDFSFVKAEDGDGDLKSLIDPDRGQNKRAVPPIWSEIMRFFTNPHKPMILALSRPDPKKNVTTLLKAFGECKPLRKLANLVRLTLTQLIRIQLRVPEYGWTTQKVFHFLNFLVNGVRCLIFVFRRDIQDLRPEIVQHVFLDVPSLAFLTTYTLLVLFWAEIYYQARGVPTDGLRPTFLTINGIIYAIQIGLWLVMWWKPVRLLVILAQMFFAGVSLFAALGFLLYGGRLFLMLKRFPVESKGRRKKLKEAYIYIHTLIKPSMKVSQGNLLQLITGVDNHETNISAGLFIRLASGGLAGITAASITYPLDLVRTRLLVQFYMNEGVPPFLHSMRM